MELDRIIHGDALEVLRGLPDGCVDAVVTDPPYGMDYQSNFRKDKAKRKAKIANDKRPFIWWLWDAYRVTKPNGALVCFTDWTHQETFRMAIEVAGFRIRSQVIWDKDWGAGLGDLGTQFIPTHEVIWFAVKGRFRFHSTRPSSVITLRKLPAELLTHPNEKPVGLMRQLVRTVTPHGGIVVDPFAGSGSTLEAAQREGMRYLGVECDAGHVATATARLEATRATPELWQIEGAA